MLEQWPIPSKKTLATSNTNLLGLLLNWVECEPLTEKKKTKTNIHIVIHFKAGSWKTFNHWGISLDFVVIGARLKSNIPSHELI